MLLADDHTLVRKGVRQLLSLHEEFEVVGEAADGRETLKKLEAVKPDIVLMDLSMEGLGGLETTREIKRRYPRIKVIILTMHSNEEYIYQSFKAGANGYLLKDCSSHELTMAVKSVAIGSKFLSPSISHNIINRYLSTSGKFLRQGPLGSLSPREKEITRLISQGKNSGEIGQILCISPNTVRAHLANSLKKLNLRSRTDLLRYLYEAKVDLDNPT